MTAIGTGAFSGCRNITSIHIPDSVTSIGNSAFSSCTSLTSIDIPEGVTSIGQSAFSSCINLKNIRIPDGVTSIEDSAFDSCKSLTSVLIPESVTNIGNRAFYACTSMTSVHIPNGVTDIKSQAFRGCRSLTAVSLPDNVIRIGRCAFMDCYGPDVAFLGSDMPALDEPVFDNASVIYCYEYSDVDFWALENGYTVVYLDANDPSVSLTITLPESLSLLHGESGQITANIFPAIDEAMLTWASSDEKVAYVDQNGVVTALSPGEATITLTCGDVSARMTMIVFTKLESFELSESEIWLVSKETSQLSTQNILPPNNVGEFIWESSDTAILTVNDGLIRALRPGTAVVTATNAGVSRTCTVHVMYPVTEISFDAEIITIDAGNEHSLTAMVTTHDQVVENKLIIFTSSDEAVATVNQAGVVTAVGCGTAVITATASSGVSASCTVTITCQHVPERIPAISPSCIEPGLTEGMKCSVCGELLTVQQEIKALGHTEVIIPGIPATHVTEGLSDGSKCDTCNAILTAQEPLPVVQVTRAVIPASIRVIAEDTFAGCRLECVIIPSSVWQIEAYAFADNTVLRFVEIPASVTEIADTAFAGCSTELVIITPIGSAAETFAQAHSIFCVTQ